ADLRGANLRDADLSHADLSYANLSHANLRGAIGWQSTEWTCQAKQQLRYILSYCRPEVPGLIAKIRAGRIDGTLYEGECTCLIGSLGNEQAVQKIPDYEKGLHNLSEQLFWQIREGDTPENSEFSKLALDVCLEFVEKP
ncbi:MAG: pentapeptide repeat-containing protein, partial [Microcoleus sp.]